MRCEWPWVRRTSGMRGFVVGALVAGVVGMMTAGGVTLLAEETATDVTLDAAAGDEEASSRDTQPGAESDLAEEAEPVAEPDEGPATESTVAAPSEPAAGRSRRVRLKLDVIGEIFAPAGRDVPPVRRPITVDARFDFVESSVGASEAATRRYRDASADIRVDDALSRLRLPAEAREVRVMVVGATPMPYLAAGFLSRDEFDLLETPFDPLLLDRILPDDPAIPADGTWSIAPDTVAGLLAIDTVESGGLEARLREVVDGLATVSISGIVDGAANGVPTHVTVEGSLVAAASETAAGMRLDRGVTSLAMTMRERREASHVAPGFDVEAKLAAAVAPIEPEALAANADAGGLAAESRPGGVGRPGFVWQHDAAGRYDLVHDSRWRVIEDGPDGLVMRLLDRGALVAQCAIVALPRGPAQSPATIAEVERDLERSLAGQFARFEHSSEAVRSDGTRLVRVVAGGSVDGRPFRWAHHVLTNAAGQRLAATFTVEEAMQKRFGETDRDLVDGLMLPPPAAGAETASSAGGDGDREARLPRESRTP